MALLALIVLNSLLSPQAEINDSVEYQQLTENLATKNLHYSGSLEASELDYRLFSKRPSGYPLFLILSSLLSSPLIVLVQALLVLLLYALGLMLLKGRTSTIIFSLFFLLSAPLFFTATFILSDLLLALIVALMLYLWQTGSTLTDQQKWWSTGWLWALALLVKPVMFPSMLVVVLLFLTKPTKRIALLLPLAVSLVLVVNNERLTGVAHLSSISTINKSHYNAKLLIASVYGQDSAEGYTSDSIFATPHSKAAFQTYRKMLDHRAMETLKTHKLAYLKVQLLGMLKCLLDPGRFETYTYFGQDTREGSLTEMIYAGEWGALVKQMKRGSWLPILYLFLLFISFVKLFGTGVHLLSKERRYLLIICVLYFVVLAGPLGAFRFLLPAYIPYLVLSSDGLAKLLSFKKGPKS